MKTLSVKRGVTQEIPAIISLVRTAAGAVALADCWELIEVHGGLELHPKLPRPVQSNRQKAITLWALFQATPSSRLLFHGVMIEFFAAHDIIRVAVLCKRLALGTAEPALNSSKACDNSFSGERRFPVGQGKGSDERLHEIFAPSVSSDAD